MPYRAGYWVDLSTVRLDDTADTLTWIQALPLGEYEHPVHGKISVTPDRVQRFAANVVSKVRGQDLDVDYDHKERTGEAAGWIKNAEAREDGLWLLVDWTKDAYTKIKNKAYRYFSPEFVDEWKHPKTGQSFQDVLFGGGLTNRPFLKDILPINMSELDAVAHTDTPTQPEGGARMDPKELRKLLGLPEDATDEQVNTKLATAFPQQPQQQTAPPAGQGDGVTVPAAATTPATPPATPAPAQVAASEMPVDIKRLAETSTDPVVKALAEQLVVQQVALRLSEVQGQVLKLSEKAGEKKRAFPPVVKDLMVKALTESRGEVATAVYQAFDRLAEVGFVQLGETNTSQGRSSDSGDPIKAFTDAIKTEQKNGLGHADAVEKVAGEQPKLFEEYRAASFAGVE
jgi:phage I-like protein